MEKKKIEEEKRPPQFDQQLIERFASGNGTVFVGAGISMRSKLPSWAQLMERLREELGNSISPSASYLDIAEMYEVAHTRYNLIRYLKKQLGDVRYQLSKTHELIVSRPVQRIYTTNFDDLLERAAHKTPTGCWRNTGSSSSSRISRMTAARTARPPGSRNGSSSSARKPIPGAGSS